MSNVSFSDAMNLTPSTEVWSSPMVREPILTSIYVVVLATLTVLGVCGNTMIIASTLAVKSLRVPCNIFIVNMAISDLLLSVVINPFAIVGTLHGKPWFEDGRWHLCIFLGSLCMVVCACSLLSILVIAFNRYVALLHNHLYRRLFSWRNSVILCVLVWIFATLLIIPLHTGWGGHGYDDKGLMCIFDRKASYSFNLVLMCVIVLVPMILIGYFYLRIFLYVRSRKVALIHSSSSSPEILNLLTTGQPKKSVARQRAEKVWSRERNLAKTLFIIFMGFFICWIPFSIVCLLDFSDRWPKEVYLFTYTIDHFSSSGLNFILYGITNTNFRRGYRKIIAKCCRNIDDRYTTTTMPYSGASASCGQHHSVMRYNNSDRNPSPTPLSNHIGSNRVGEDHV